ncbi:response regulator [Paraburkholderia sediminicola]|uniref:response regulator n=1 Tax=Paraburkholderia sediminicola TaxID=458836 RepID=UPI0038BCFDBB
MESIALSLPVLMYHHVSESNGSLNISPECFESQMNWLARNGYVTLTADEFTRFLRGAPMPDKSILLTFDDGYLDNYIHAHPCLERYGFNAVMFLVTGRIHDGPVRPAMTARAARSMSHAECEQRVQAGRSDDVTARWSEIELMRKAGTFEFHSHTNTHLRWDMLCSDSVSKRHRIAQDIEISKCILAGRMGSVSTRCAAMPDTLLLIEDDLPFAALTTEFLRSENFEVVIAHRGDVAVKMIDAVRPDLLVMDVMLPGMVGFSLCREIRSSYSGRILMMTALDEDVEQLMSFHVGADDFVVKPIDPLLLVARIRVLLRRDIRLAKPGRVFDHTFGDFRLDLHARRAWLDDKAVAFSVAKFDLLSIFARHAGTPLKAGRSAGSSGSGCRFCIFSAGNAVIRVPGDDGDG